MARVTRPDRGYVAGQPQKYLRGHYRNAQRSGRNRGLESYEVRDTGLVTPCWIWTGLVRDTNGRGIYRANGQKTTNAHRAVFIAQRGPIPDGMHLDHLCRNKLCVNPDHMEVVTPRENTLRRFRPMDPRMLHPMQGAA